MWPAWIEKLQISGFKTFADAAIELKSCNVLIGGNGAGKSNVLSLFKLLRALGQGELQVYLAKAGGANDLLYRAAPRTTSLEIGLALRTTTGSSRYQLRAERTDDDALLILSEQIERFDLNGQTGGMEANQHAARESPLAEPGRRAGEH